MTDVPQRMRISEQGLELIRSFEGLRLAAYRDVGGIWTIGYGHTSAAGLPDVKQGMTITREEAARILARDAGQFAEGVAQRVKVTVSQAQFDALVSFAYNVGLRNFERSSVLKAVNESDFGAVPRRLALWTKAAGIVLPGLIRRRAAEAELFASEGVLVAPHKTVPQSKTLWAAMTIILTALANAFEVAAQWICVALIVAAAIFIIQQRIQKLKEEGL
jgi:lysozyme